MGDGDGDDPMAALSMLSVFDGSAGICDRDGAGGVDGCGASDVAASTTSAACGVSLGLDPARGKTFKNWVALG